MSLDCNANQTSDMDTNEKPTDTLKTNGHKIVTRGRKGLVRWITKVNNFFKTTTEKERLSSGEVLESLFTIIISWNTPHMLRVHIDMASTAAVSSSRREVLDMSRPVRFEIMVW